MKYQFRNKVSPTAFGLYGEVFGFRLRYKMDGIAGNPMFDIRNKARNDGLYPSEDDAKAAARNVALGMEVTIQACRPARMVRSGFDADYAAVDADTAALPPVPNGGADYETVFVGRLADAAAA